MSEQYKFKAEILGGGPRWPKAALIEFPYDTVDAFGKKGQVKVMATFDGVPYQGSLSKMGYDCHILVVTKAIRAAIGKEIGDWVEVCIEEDTSIRVVEVPKDIVEWIQSHDEALWTFFDGLSYSNKKAYVDWLTGAKREDTKAKRRNLLIEHLKNGRKQP